MGAWLVDGGRERRTPGGVHRHSVLLGRFGLGGAGMVAHIM